jgi:hypothetical protein
LYEAVHRHFDTFVVGGQPRERLYPGPAATQRRPLEADRSGVSLRGLGKIEAGRIGRPRPSTVRRNCSGSRSARVSSIEDEELILRAGVVSPADRGRYGACGVLGAMFGVEEQLLARTQVHR